MKKSELLTYVLKNKVTFQTSVGISSPQDLWNLGNELVTVKINLKKELEDLMVLQLDLTVTPLSYWIIS